MKVRAVLYLATVLLFTNCFGKKNVVVSKQKTVIVSKQKPVIVSKQKPDVVLLEKKPTNLPSVEEKKHIIKLEYETSNLSADILDYIEKYAAIAVNEMHKHQIPASITLAQGILESGSGNGVLAKKANNHFGIKCHIEWQGDYVYHDDDKAQECFRKYEYVETSYYDHSAFLTSRSRYDFLFDYGSKNYKKWAEGLKKAGYATDSQYPNKLIRIIENYKLHEFDNVDKKGFIIVSKNDSNKNNEIIFHKVKKGETLHSISREFNVPVFNLIEKNNLIDTTLFIGQNLLIK